jgi:16S rRNA (cytidine1402-2'-O)-methyltransferase
MTGGGMLILVGTPIGNRADLSARARETIETADLLLCEDTRSPARLLGEGATLPRRVSCFVGNEHERVEAAMEAIAAGNRVVFVSEAGMPVWSDPGRLLVEAAWRAGHAIDVVPGPSAASAALAVSGFEAEGAVFIGFVVRSGGARAEQLDAIADSAGASILYEAGNRVGKLLSELAERRPARLALVGRELTKRHQELRRGTLAELAAEVDAGAERRGEFTIVVRGAGTANRVDDGATQAARAVLEAMTDASLRPRARAKQIAQLTGLDATEVYARISKSRGASD